MSRSIRTLIVASTERLRRAYRDLLAGVPGFEIVELAPPEDAREAALRHQPDLLLFALEPPRVRELTLASDLVAALRPMPAAPLSDRAADDPPADGTARSAGDPPEREALSSLTPREREVIRMAAEGLSSTETGRQLGISARTAECHRAHGMRKLGLHRRADLVRFAMTAGLVGGRTDLR